MSDSLPQFKVLVVFTNSLESYPKEIGQSDNQLVLLHDSHVFFSPYKTETQKTTIKLSSSSIESYTKRAPHNQKGGSITYGPYKEINPFTVRA